MLFITPAPARDNPERLREYMACSDPGFAGLGVSMAEIKVVAQQYGTHLEKAAADDADDHCISRTHHPSN